MVGISGSGRKGGLAGRAKAAQRSQEVSRSDSTDDETVRSLRARLEASPEDSKLWFELGTTYAALSKFESAVRCFEIMLGLDPMNAAAWNAKGEALSKMGDFEGSANCHKEALRIVEALARDKRRDTEEEEKAIKSMLREPPGGGKEEECRKALKTCDGLLSKDPDDTDALFARSLILGKMGSYVDAMKCLDRISEISGAGADLLRTRGDLLYKMGEHEKAGASYQKAQKVLEDMVSCPLCGHYVVLEDAKCGSCGIEFEDEKSEGQASVPPKSAAETPTRTIKRVKRLKKAR